jgi:hypothetical protein
VRNKPALNADDPTNDGPGSTAWAGMTLWSEVADGIDYYFFHGPAADSVIAGLREATCRANALCE